jgi:CAAX protease family protein
MGVIWGLLRLMSGSIVVSSVSHSVWNAIAYALFGEGPKIGLLGVTQTGLYGAEVGVIGLALNCIFALALFAVQRKASRIS